MMLLNGKIPQIVSEIFIENLKKIKGNIDKNETFENMELIKIGKILTINFIFLELILKIYS